MDIELIDINDYSHLYLNDGLKHEESLKRYKKRREDLLKKIKKLTVIYGKPDPRKDNIWDSFPSIIHQETLLLYLTGINQSDTALILDPSSDEKEILFLPKFKPKDEFWNGIKISIGDDQKIAIAKQVTGFNDIQDIATVQEVLVEKIRKSRRTIVCTYWHEASGKRKKVIQDSNYLFRNRLNNYFKRNKLNRVKLQNIAATVWDSRPIVDASDKKNLKIAYEKLAEIFSVVHKNMPKYKNETQVAGFIDGQIGIRTSFRNSFPTIAASGKNATTLHYIKNNSELNKNELILIDFGLRWHSMCSDISRTIPLSGKFNPLQKLLYQIVLDAQKLVESKAKPGINIIGLNTICWDFINDQLKKQITAKGGKITKFYNTHPHKVGHFIGIQVHDGDPFGEYRYQLLKPGHVISNEPGIYGEFEMSLNGQHYHEKIGIRIEDTLLITAKGCQNLCKAIPKEISDIEWNELE